jgi:hypothetical protein
LCFRRRCRGQDLGFQLHTFSSFIGFSLAGSPSGGSSRERRTGERTSMLKMPNSREHHRQAMFIRGSDHLGVAD